MGVMDGCTDEWMDVKVGWRVDEVDGWMDKRLAR